MDNIGKVVNAMVAYYENDIKRINHFLKVYGLAKTIGELEKLEPEIQNILEIAALTHDIGIKNSEKKYGSSAGNYQQLEGPAEAEKMLLQLDVEKEKIERINFLIAHHHTYTNIEGMDYQILVEADFLVNIFEDEMQEKEIQKIKEKIFKTKTGKEILKKMYGEKERAQ